MLFPFYLYPFKRKISATLGLLLGKLFLAIFLCAPFAHVSLCFYFLCSDCIKTLDLLVSFLVDTISLAGKIKKKKMKFYRGPFR